MPSGMLAGRHRRDESVVRFQLEGTPSGSSGVRVEVRQERVERHEEGHAQEKAARGEAASRERRGPPPARLRG